MSKASTTFSCPVCKDRRELSFKPPSLVGQSVCSVACSTCESDFTVIIKRQRGGKRGEIMCDVKCDRLGQLGINIMTNRKALEEVQSISDDLAKGANL